jgi:hypothetical protein
MPKINMEARLGSATATSYTPAYLLCEMTIFFKHLLQISITDSKLRNVTIVYAAFILISIGEQLNSRVQTDGFKPWVTA